MKISIREMTLADCDRKGYVHYKSWAETYTGLMDEQFIMRQTLEKCRAIAHKWPGNTLVALVDGEIVGFGCYVRGEAGGGEVSAIYLLNEFQGLGIGKQLMDALLEQLSNCAPITLWVLHNNDRAIGFYQHYGFHATGREKRLPLGTELEMTYCASIEEDCHTSVRTGSQ